jgi:hypothetical protein
MAEEEGAAMDILEEEAEVAEVSIRRVQEAEAVPVS